MNLKLNVFFIVLCSHVLVDLCYATQAEILNKTACEASLTEEKDRSWSMEQRQELLKLYGRKSYIAYSTLQDNMLYFDMQIGERKAYIAYRVRSNIPLALGDPIAHEDDLPIIIKAFLEKFERLKMPAPSFCSASVHVAKIMNGFGHYANEIGREAIIDLTTFDANSSEWSRGRKDTRSAVRKGFTVRKSTWNVESKDPHFMEQVHTINREWIASRPGGEKELDFLNRPFKLDDEDIYIVELGNQLAAFYVLESLYDHGKKIGYLINFKRYVQDSAVFPSDADFAGFMRILEDAKAEGMERVSLGISALYKVDDMSGGLKYSWITSTAFRFMYSLSEEKTAKNLTRLEKVYYPLYSIVSNWIAKKIGDDIFNFATLAYYKFTRRKGDDSERWYLTTPVFFNTARIIAIAYESKFIEAKTNTQRNRQPNSETSEVP